MQWPIACTVALMAAGCHVPWSTGPNFSQRDPLPASAASDAEPEPARSITAVKPQLADDEPRAAAPLSASPEADFAGVLAQLERAGNIDPEAQRRLISDLRRTKPELWPLVAAQFNATLAYQEQLNAKQALMEHSDHQDQPAARLSSEIGGLLDPRGLSRSPESREDGAPVETLTVAPFAAAPTEFHLQEPAVPINASHNDSQRARHAFEAAEKTTANRTGATSATALATYETQSHQDSVAPNLLTPMSDPPATQPIAADDAASGERDNWKALIHRAAAELDARVTSSPQSTAEVHQHVTLRVLRLLVGQTEEALEPIPGISPVEQDYWSQQLFALAIYLDHHKQPEERRRAAASVTYLDEAVAKLRELGSLSLRNLTFCTAVYDFGAFEPFPDERFTPGEQVSIYVEVENYRSQSTEKGYRTLLGATYEIVDDDGGRVAGGEFPDVEDECRSRRRDFHIEYGLALPQDLAPGSYRMRLVLKDRQSDKLGSAELPFDVTAAAN